MRTRSRRAGLLDDAALEMPAIVANCSMNRERQLAGVNSDARELGFNPLLVDTARSSISRLVLKASGAGGSMAGPASRV